MLYPEMLRDLDFLLLVPRSENLRPTELLRHFLLYPEMHRDLDFLLLVPRSENLWPTELLRHYYKELIFKK